MTLARLRAQRRRGHPRPSELGKSNSNGFCWTLTDRPESISPMASTPPAASSSLEPRAEPPPAGEGRTQPSPAPRSRSLSLLWLVFLANGQVLVIALLLLARCSSSRCCRWRSARSRSTRRSRPASSRSCWPASSCWPAGFDAFIAPMVVADAVPTMDLNAQIERSAVPSKRTRGVSRRDWPTPRCRHATPAARSWRPAGRLSPRSPT
jgi:hypothetical protein